MDTTHSGNFDSEPFTLEQVSGFFPVTSSWQGSTAGGIEIGVSEVTPEFVGSPFTLKMKGLIVY